MVLREVRVFGDVATISMIEGSIVLGVFYGFDGPVITYAEPPSGKVLVRHFVFLNRGTMVGHSDRFVGAFRIGENISYCYEVIR